MGRQIEQAAGDRFLELYGHLPAYVNSEYNEVSDIETYADLREQQDTELRPIRTRLYEEDTERLITDFVAENPADLDNDELEAVEQWIDYAFGEFVVVRHLDEYALFLDWEAPLQAFGVTACSAHTVGTAMGDWNAALTTAGFPATPRTPATGPDTPLSADPAHPNRRPPTARATPTSPAGRRSRAPSGGFH